MQHKPRFSGLKMAALLAAIVLVGSVAVMMMTDIPAPQHLIQKQLDAKDFLEQKQP